MFASALRLPASDGTEIFVYRWEPQGTPRAVVQVAHGLAEHAARYARLAEHLVHEGHAVYANDHRGHGRTAPPETRGFFAEQGGWQRVVGDLAAVSDRIARDHPGRPQVLLGHSMGSFLAQSLAIQQGERLAGLALSGSSSGPAAPELVELARAERERLGPRAPSETLAAASFGSFNAAFPDARTDFDWLSRDAAEVDAYVADPLCGFAVSAQLWLDLAEGLDFVADPRNLARLPGELPVYVFSGDRDPVHRELEGLRALLAGLRDAGLARLRHRFYPEGRHEMLNEVNRAEVMDDLVAWLGEIL